MGSKRLKKKKKKDRISDLPDSIIHQILSFLPSTKQAIRTSILSKNGENNGPISPFSFSIYLVLSAWEIRGVSSPSINSKCLTLDCGYKFVENLPGIVYALRTSPELEKLVIHLGHFQYCGCGTPVSKESYYWDSKGAVFKCLVSHLKIVEIFGLSRKHDEELELALNLVEYLLNNARVLEKMVIKLEHRRADFVFEDFDVSQKLSSFSRFSQHAIVELS